MPFDKDDHISMQVWFPLLPEEDVRRLKGNEIWLERINSAYDDWKASMRSKPFMGTKIGVIFDRIRMLTISIGIASGNNREIAEKVQSMLSKRLKQSAIQIIGGITRDFKEKDFVKKVLIEFFVKVKFTRDNDPEYDIERIIRGKIVEKGGDEIIDVAIKEATNVVKRLYIRLLSEDPWNDS